MNTSWKSQTRLKVSSYKDKIWTKSHIFKSRDGIKFVIGLIIIYDHLA